MNKWEKPLSGQKILITRSEEQALPFVHAVERKGGEAIVIPLLSFQIPENTSHLKEASRSLKQYKWIVFTSQNAVAFFIDRMKQERQPLDLLRSCKIAAIGKKTVKLLKELGVEVDFYPTEFVAEQFAKEFIPHTDPGDKILLPHGNLARSTIKDYLTENGRNVDAVITYETVANRSNGDRLHKVIRNGEVDIVTFTSSSTVHFYFELLDNQLSEKNLITACIGPVTAKTLEEYGTTADIVAEEYTIDGLVNSIEAYLLKEETL